MNLTNNFTLEELTFSQEAQRKGLDNTPKKGILTNLINTAENMELVRNVLEGKPIIISSAYRSPEVNAAVGGSKNSQHMEGKAVDFTCPKYGSPDQIVHAIICSMIDYDQLILEFNSWVHISFSDRNRKQALIIDRSGTRAYA
jgi:zinc D-Ala-D-Ala carboxypeptidase